MAKKKKLQWLSDIVLIDIINFSKLSSENQVEIINFLTASYRKMIEKMLSNSNMTLEKFLLGFVSTGDGFFCIINPRLKGYGTMLGLSFHYLSEQVAKKYPYFEGIRIVVHTGHINQFTDILGHKNYIGDGLNECSRYLEMKEYSITTVMVSDKAFESLKNFLMLYKDFDTLLMQREFKHSKAYTFKDKHDVERSGCLVWLRKAGIINPPKMNFNSII